MANIHPPPLSIHYPLPGGGGGVCTIIVTLQNGSVRPDPHSNMEYVNFESSQHHTVMV